VSYARVTVDTEVTGAIERGLCVLVSVGPEDDEAVAGRLARRVATLRVFPDDAGRMNLDVRQAGGAVLVVSQFTLHADTSRGHRPSFIGAAAPDLAVRLYEAFAAVLRVLDLEVATGRFGAHMQVELNNDGPVTLVLSSAEGPWEADAG
jgi:D-tyrosyl-tRNA(Tyr) deacylase